MFEMQIPLRNLYKLRLLEINILRGTILTFKKSLQKTYLHVNLLNASLLFSTTQHFNYLVTISY